LQFAELALQAEDPQIQLDGGDEATGPPVCDLEAQRGLGARWSGMAGHPLGQLDDGCYMAGLPERDRRCRRCLHRWCAGKVEVKRVSDLGFKNKEKGILLH
jgi:hypothetical protein